MVDSVCWFLDNDTKQVRCWASSYFALGLDPFIFNKISCAQRLWVSDCHKDIRCLNYTVPLFDCIRQPQLSVLT